MLIFVFLFLTYFIVKLWRFYSTVRRIPSPKGKPIVGNLLFLLAKPDLMFRKVRKYALEFYPIYRLSCFYFTTVAVLEPNDVELVLSTSKHLSKSRIYSYLHRWLGTGLLTSSGAKWQQRRKILTPAFHFDILQEFVAIFNEETGNLVKVFDQNVGEVVDVVPLVTNFTLKAIGETAMGLSDVNEEDYLKYKNAVYRMGQILLKRIAKPWLHIQKLYNVTALGMEEQNVVEILKSFSNGIITKKEQENGSTCTKKKRLAMLDLLLTAKRMNHIDHEGIHEEVDTFMFEGHDTTAMAISFLLLTLSNNPQIQNNVYDEISTTLGPTSLPTLQQLQSLKYTERCIKETLRLFPSVPFITRRASEDFCTTTGYKILKDTIIHIHIFDIHRNPNLYLDPLKFDPDRFLYDRHPFAFIPFSAGPRNCIGQRFAILELKSVLCGILRKFVIEKVDDMLEVDFKPDLVLRPRNGIRVVLKRRK